jgi:hypothetical protein
MGYQSNTGFIIIIEVSYKFYRNCLYLIVRINHCNYVTLHIYNNNTIRETKKKINFVSLIYLVKLT